MGHLHAGSMTQRIASILTPVLLLLAVGCGPRWTEQTISIPTLRPRTEPTARAGGLEVTVAPITVATMRTTPGVTVRVPIRSGAIVYPLIPMPAFRVRIVNRSGHVVRLEDAVFRLDAPGSGVRFHPIEEIDGVVSWIRTIYAAELARNPGLAVNLNRGLEQLPLLSRGAVLLDGDDSTFFLVFDLPSQSYADYTALLSAHRELVLRLAEVPVSFDQAGDVTEASDLRFAMDVVGASITLLCAGQTVGLDTCAVPE